VGGVIVCVRGVGGGGGGTRLLKPKIGLSGFK